MTELDDRLDEARAAVARMDPPGDLWDRALERAHADGPSELDRIDDRRRRPSSRWLAAAAVAACLLAVAAVAAVVTRDDREVVTSHQPEPTTTTTTGDGSSLLAKGEHLSMGSTAPSPWRTLNVDAEQRADQVSGTFRVDGVVVAIECADTETSGDDLILGGTVTEDPSGRGLAVTDGDVAVGDLVTLVIRQQARTRDRVTFRPGDGAASCAELVESVPYNLDGGFFQDVEPNIVTGRLNGAPIVLAKANGVRFGGRQLDIAAEEEDGEVTGELRVDNVVVSVECVDSNASDDEVRLGGTVVADPDGQGLDVIDGHTPGDAPAGMGKAGTGDRVALILREDADGTDRIALYADGRQSTCAGLVESIRDLLDGGYFAHGAGGTGIKTDELDGD